MLGSLIPISLDALGFFKRALGANDRVFLRVPGRRVLLLCHPNDIEDVLVRNRASYGRSAEILKLRPIFGEGLLASEGELWRKQRSAIQPSFSHDVLSSYHAIMLRVMKRVGEGWKSSQWIDVQEEMMRFTRDVMWQVLFSQELQDGDALGGAVSVVFGDLRSEVLYLPLWRRLPFARSRRWNQAVSLLNETVTTRIKERRSSGQRKGDLLDALLYASAVDQAKISDAQVHDEILTFFLAGHETAALSLTWSVYLLACHPEIQERVAHEIRNITASRDLASGDLARLPLTTAVVKEALRLFPPVWTMGRRASCNVELDGIPIAKGTDIWMCLYRTHRDLRWFADPDAFLPDRWLQTTSPKPFSYIPFGIGPRVCIGQHFAMAEAVLGLAATVDRYSFPPPARSAVPSAWITLRPKSMRLNIESRNATSLS